MLKIAAAGINSFGSRPTCRDMLGRVGSALISSPLHALAEKVVIFEDVLSIQEPRRDRFAKMQFPIFRFQFATDKSIRHYIKQ